MTALVKLYVKKVDKGELLLDQVPIRWRSEVEEELIKIRNKE